MCNYYSLSKCLGGTWDTKMRTTQSLPYGACGLDGETEMKIKKHNTIYLCYPQEHRLKLLLDNVAITMNK